MYHHGGEIYEHKIQYDFSVNLNPLGLPESVRRFLIDGRAAYYAGVYPQNGNAQLAEAIAKKAGADVGQIVCGNGASELISSVFATLRPGSVLLPVPSFAAYEQAAAVNGCRIIYHETKESECFAITDAILAQIESERPEMIVLCSPSNPVGNSIRPEILKQIISLAGQTGSAVFMDECFGPFLEERERLSARDCLAGIAREDRPLLLSLGAFTKIYAMPGLRLGYLITEQEVAVRIRSHLPEWNVSAPAQQAGMLALAEEDYEEKTRQFLCTERKRMRAELEKLGAVVYGGEANYLFWKGKAGLKEKLLEKGILIRDCSNYRGLEDLPKDMCYYRTAIRSFEENEVLLLSLRQIGSPGG